MEVCLQTCAVLIKEEDFELEEEEGRWNLSLLKHIGGANPRDEMKFVGYGYSMITALRLVAKNRLARKQEVYSLSEFMQAYTNEVDKLITAVKGVDSGIRSVTV